jgi:transcriptional accessory protein Tex/SPT6
MREKEKIKELKYRRTWERGDFDLNTLSAILNELSKSLKIK